jgi:hypothetical protein
LPSCIQFNLSLAEHLLGLQHKRERLDFPGILANEQANESSNQSSAIGS